MVDKVFLADMSWAEVESRLKQTDIALIPTGSTEQHAILPLKTDIFIATEIARRAAEKVRDDVKPVISPPVPFGYSPEWLEWPGTISVGIETLRNLLMDIVGSLIHHGFKKIVVVNGHGSNPPILWQVMTETNRKRGAQLAVINWYELITDAYNRVIEKKGGAHAEELETSMVLALGEKPDMAKAPVYNPPLAFPKFQNPTFSSLYAQPVYSWRTGQLREGMPDGALGDATKAGKEKGEKILTAAVDRLAEFLREFKAKKVEEGFW